MAGRGGENDGRGTISPKGKSARGEVGDAKSEVGDAIAQVGDAIAQVGDAIGEVGGAIGQLGGAIGRAAAAIGEVGGAGEGSGDHDRRAGRWECPGGLTGVPAAL
jgi:hypothetical protein